MAQIIGKNNTQMEAQKGGNSFLCLFFHRKFTKHRLTNDTTSHIIYDTMSLSELWGRSLKFTRKNLNFKERPQSSPKVQVANFRKGGENANRYF